MRLTYINVIDSSDTWESIYNILDFIRITPHAEESLIMEQLTEYMEISDPDRILPSLNDGGLCEYDILRAKVHSTAPYTHPVTYIAFPNKTCDTPDINNTMSYQYISQQGDAHCAPLKLTNRKVI